METLDSLLSLIPFLLLLTRNIVIDFDGLESMNEWQWRKREIAAATTSTATTTIIVVVVAVSNGPNYLSNDLINNQNLQYEIISNQSDCCFVTTFNLSMQTDNQMIFSSFILKSESIHIDSFNYVDCLKLICILGICLFSHIEFVLHFDHST